MEVVNFAYTWTAGAISNFLKRPIYTSIIKSFLTFIFYRHLNLQQS